MLGDLALTGQSYMHQDKSDTRKPHDLPPLPPSASRLLGRSVRVRISDGRVFYGRLVGFDAERSVLLQAADEYAAGGAAVAVRGTPSEDGKWHPDDAALVFRRNVDDVMVPGDHLVALAVREPENSSMEEE